VVLLALFAVIESRAANPLVPLRLFRDRSVSLGTVTVLLSFFALFGVLFFVSLYLQSVHGYDPVQAGVRSLPLTAVFMVASPLSAVLTTRFGPRVPITIGMLAVSGGLFGLTGLAVNTPYLLLAPPLLAMGLGMGLVVVASTEAIVGNVPAADSGLAGGLQSTALQLGGVLGSSVLGSILASRVGSVLAGHLTAHGVPAPVAGRYLAAKQFVGQGLAPLTPGVPHQLGVSITAGAHAAFLSGLHVALLAGAILVLLGAACGPFIRRGAHTEAMALAV